MIDAGRVVAEGTPDALKSVIGADRLEVTVRDADALARTAAILGAAEADVDPETRRIRVPVTDRVGALIGAARALQDAGITVLDLGVHRPTLDEVFLALTGDSTQTATQTGGRA